MRFSANEQQSAGRGVVDRRSESAGSQNRCKQQNKQKGPFAFRNNLAARHKLTFIFLHKQKISIPVFM